MLGRKSSAFCDKLFDRVVETAFQLHMGTIWAEKHSDENLTFSCSDIERNVSTFVRKFSDWVVRTAFHLAKGIFWEVSVLSFPPFFRTLSKKSPWFCRLFINWVVKTAFVVSVRAPRVEYFLEKSCRVLFITFGLSDKKILLSDKNISPCLSKVHSNCPLNQFDERFPLETFLGQF